jgi:hypothetical protein
MSAFERAGLGDRWKRGMEVRIRFILRSDCVKGDVPDMKQAAAGDFEELRKIADKVLDLTDFPQPEAAVPN